jgi:hypothetical protein
MSVPNLAQVQWIWEGKSQLAEDNFVNTYHFEASGSSMSDPENVRDMLVDFYTEKAPDQGAAICEYMSSDTVTGKWTIKMYNLSDPKPRYPFYTDTGTAAVSGGSGMPTENAIVMSFQGIRIAGEEQRRRRNRVFLGPWMIQANDAGMVEGNLVEQLLFASKGLLRASQAASSWTWTIYSAKNDDVVAIDNGWVDNGWDTQRRRGTRATARGTFDANNPT